MGYTKTNNPETMVVAGFFSMMMIMFVVTAEVKIHYAYTTQG